MHTVRVITVLTTRRPVELVALVVLETAVPWWSPWRWQSVVVVPQPGQFISQRFGIICTSLSLLLQSISPLLLRLCMYITRITLCHVLFYPSSSSCSYSLLHLSSLGPWLRLHLLSSGPRLRLLLSGPGSKCPSSLEPRLRLHLPSSGPGSDSFSWAPAPNVLPLLSPRLRLLKTHAPFPPSPHFCILPLIEYSSLQFHFDIQQNDISPNIIIMC